MFLGCLGCCDNNCVAETRKQARTNVKELKNPHRQECLRFAAIGTDRVGQVGNLRRIVNPPWLIRNLFTGRLPIGRRLPTCPTELVCDRLSKNRRGVIRLVFECESN